jgi:hypothetical protein
VRQFYGESLLYVLSALALAAGLTALLVPPFNSVTRTHLSVSVLSGLGTLAAAGIVALAILLSGSYHRKNFLFRPAPGSRSESA